MYQNTNYFVTNYKVGNQLLNLQAETKSQYQIFSNLYDDFLSNSSQPFITDTQVSLYRLSHNKRWLHIMRFYDIHIARPINEKHIPYLDNNLIKQVIDDSNSKSLVVIIITIVLGLLELLGITFTIINAKNIRKTEHQLNSIKTEKNIQQNLTSMLSHDLKGSVGNIVGEITHLKENLTEQPEHINDIIQRSLYEATHIQRCIRSLQIKADILGNRYIPKYKEFNITNMLELFTYKYMDKLNITIEKDVKINSNEDIIYSIFNNGIRNGIKQGQLNGIVSINSNKIDDYRCVSIINKSGLNHNKMLELQKEYGENWLFETTNNLSDLEIGNIDSSYKGLKDMNTMALSIDCKIKLIFTDDEAILTLLIPEPDTEVSIHIGIDKDYSIKCLNDRDTPTNTKIGVTEVEIPEVVNGLPEVVNGLPEVVNGLPEVVNIYFMGIDDHNISRIFLFKLGKQLDVTIENSTIDKTEMRNNFYRNEEYMKIYGRTSDEVNIDEIRQLAIKWKDKASVIVLDQNIDFTSTIYYGTDICKVMRKEGFNGVILIRSSNDNDSDENMYIDCGADGILSKTVNIKNSQDEMIKWKNEAIRRYRYISK